MNTPQRVQRKRTKGWRMPEGVVYVGRPSKWGNPIDWQSYPTRGYEFKTTLIISDGARRNQAVIDFRANLLAGRLSRYPSGQAIRDELEGRDLACWCPLDQPCHADVLIEIANGGAW